MSTQDDIRQRPDGKWEMSRALYERKRRHDYAGRKDGKYWTLYNDGEHGTCLIPDVQVVPELVE